MHVKKDLYQSLTQCVYICGSPENAHYSHKNLRFYRVFGFPGGSTDTIVSAFCLVKRPPPPTGSIMALARLNEPRCGWLLSRHAPPQNRYFTSRDSSSGEKKGLGPLRRLTLLFRMK